MAASGAVSSCMDLSDGLGNACRTICARSHVGMEIEWEFLPIGEEVEEICALCRKDVKETVVRWGGDYELLFTFDKSKIQDLYDAGVAFSIIGVVTNDSAPYLCDGEQRSATSWHATFAPTAAAYSRKVSAAVPPARRLTGNWWHTTTAGYRPWPWTR